MATYPAVLFKFEPPRDRHYRGRDYGGAARKARLIRLEPGAYTTVVTGSDGGAGIALVEVYEINRD